MSLIERVEVILVEPAEVQGDAGRAQAEPLVVAQLGRRLDPRRLVLAVTGAWQNRVQPALRRAIVSRVLGTDAMRAAEMTSPFLALPARIVSSVSRVIVTKPSATASRTVSSLSPTSTMSALMSVPS